MTYADSPAGLKGQSGGVPASAELIILGGGIMGLWAAVKAERLGIETLLVEAGTFGQGASGGLLGALMPHMPDKWNDKKQFQFDALLSLEEEVGQIERATGMTCGYRRSGRLIPLPKQHLRMIAQRHSEDAKGSWHQQGREFHWHVMDDPAIAGWPDASFCEAGLVHETFAARVSPRGLVLALVACLRSARHVRLVEGAAAGRIDTGANRVMFVNGESTSFGRCIVAAGHHAFPLIEAISRPLPKPIGQAVKGQAALLKADVDPALPVIFLNGLYVVAHEGGYVAVGSTSEDMFDEPFSTDAKLDDLIARARVVVPALAGAEVVERWAGLRPKAIDRDPMVGPHPDHRQVIALTGGFKVSFGLAHRLAGAALAAATGSEMRIPGSFTLENHLEVASR
jgi:glycine oxidase